MRYSTREGVPISTFGRQRLARYAIRCNVIVYEESEATIVTAVDPEAAMSITANQALGEIAREAKERLKRAIERL